MLFEGRKTYGGEDEDEGGETVVVDENEEFSSLRLSSLSLSFSCLCLMGVSVGGGDIKERKERRRGDEKDRPSRLIKRTCCLCVGCVQNRII